MDAYIELNNITKRFGQNIVLENISFSVKKGAAVGLVGANGSGKSVLFKILCGFERPDSGQVLIRGKQLGKGRDFPEHVGVFINSPRFCWNLQRSAEPEISGRDSGEDRRKRDSGGHAESRAGP